MKTGIIKNVEVKVLELPLKKQWKDRKSVV